VTPTTTGMAVGAVLAIVAVTLGFWAFLLTVVAIVLGALAGRYVEGRLDLSGLLEVLSGRRSSS
jgi:uncharacterized membrane protein